MVWAPAAFAPTVAFAGMAGPGLRTAEVSVSLAVRLHDASARACAYCGETTPVTDARLAEFSIRFEERETGVADCSGENSSFMRLPSRPERACDLWQRIYVLFRRRGVQRAALSAWR